MKQPENETASATQRKASFLSIEPRDPVAHPHYPQRPAWVEARNFRTMVVEEEIRNAS